MSQWVELDDKDSLTLSDDGRTLDVLIDSDDFGNNYLQIPVEWVTEVLQPKTQIGPDNI